MYKIIDKATVTPHIHRMDIYAPAVAHKSSPGQFVIIRVNKYGERIPITIAGTDPEKGLVRIYIAEVGASSKDVRIERTLALFWRNTSPSVNCVLA